jgi:hypothetical protein
MALSRRDVERALSRKLDMVLDEDRDHRFYLLVVNGKPAVRTKVSTGSGYRTLGDDLVGAMARQLNVPIPFFRDIVSCAKGQDDYLQHLSKTGVI